MDAYAMRALSYGLYIVTSKDGEKPVGCTANSAMQITSSPQTIALSINHDNYTNGCIKKIGKFAVSVLGENSDAQLIGKFGFASCRDTDKFKDTDYKMCAELPVISDSCAYMVCKVIDTMETSTHTVFLGEVIEAEQNKKDEPMTYAYYHKVVKGKSPKNAPTYIAEEQPPQEEKPAAKAKWVCTICGYEYNGDVPFEELPDDYACPICGVSKSMFQKVEA